MTERWILRDYLAANGRNLIHEWLNEQPPKAKAKINVRLKYLEVTRPLPGRPHTATLVGYDGLMEIRIPFNKVQYRPICCYGPGNDDITLLIGAREKGDRFEPRNAPDIAEERRANIETEGHTCEHNDT